MPQIVVAEFLFGWHWVCVQQAAVVAGTRWQSLESAVKAADWFSGIAAANWTADFFTGVGVAGERQMKGNFPEVHMIPFVPAGFDHHNGEMPGEWKCAAGNYGVLEAIAVFDMFRFFRWES